MARFVFPSIARSKQIAYAFDTASYGSAPVHDDFREYQTFGDGLIAHGSDYPIQDEDLIDFLESLGAHLLEHPELSSTVAWALRSDSRKKDITFAASIEYKDTSDKFKYQYYSMEGHKISTAPGRKNDRRYERVAQWMDGSYDAVVKTLTRDYFSRWQLYLLHDDVRQWFIDNRDSYNILPSMQVGFAKTGDAARRIRHAHEAALFALQAAENAYNARRRLEEYRHELEAASTAQTTAMQEQIDAANQEQASDAN